MNQVKPMSAHFEWMVDGPKFQSLYLTHSRDEPIKIATIGLLGGQWRLDEACLLSFVFTNKKEWYNLNKAMREVEKTVSLFGTRLIEAWLEKRTRA